MTTFRNGTRVLVLSSAGFNGASVMGTIRSQRMYTPYGYTGSTMYYTVARDVIVSFETHDDGPTRYVPYMANVPQDVVRALVSLVRPMPCDGYACTALTSLRDVSDEDSPLCEDCQPTCEDCQAILSDLRTVQGASTVRPGLSHDRDVCEPCADDHYLECSHHCGGELFAEGLARNCSSCGTVCRSCYADLYHCAECDSQYCADNGCDGDHDDEDGYLHDYSYTPSLRFLSLDEDGDVKSVSARLASISSTPYLGLELEITCNPRLMRLIDEEEDMAYCKSDSSINGGGMEIVTHPMTFEYFGSKFPWSRLRELKNEGARAGGNGLHVHISRSAFVDDAHVLRWVMLAYRNEDALQGLARRRGSSWAKFTDGDSSSMVSKARGSRDGDRYQAINATNDATLEMRVFASSLNPEKVRASLGYVAASWEYTKSLTAQDALSGALAWQSFFVWADAQTNDDGSAKYGDLTSQMVKQNTVTFGPALEGEPVADDVIVRTIATFNGESVMTSGIEELSWQVGHGFSDDEIEDVAETLSAIRWCECRQCAIAVLQNPARQAEINAEYDRTHPCHVPAAPAIIVPSSTIVEGPVSDEWIALLTGAPVTFGGETLESLGLADSTGF